MGGDAGFTLCTFDGPPVLLPAWSGDEQGATRKSATASATNRYAVGLESFMGVVRVVRTGKDSARNIGGILEGTN